MTDSDPPNSQHGNGRSPDPRKNVAPRLFDGVKIIAATGRRAANQADPTDPEVPNAKRLRAVRRQRAMFVLGVVIVGLLSFTLALLYKTGRQVTSARPPADEGAAPAAKALRPTAIDLEAPSEAASAPASSQIDLPDPSRTTMPTGSAARAIDSGGARAKPKAPASDIFRKPSF